MTAYSEELTLPVADGSALPAFLARPAGQASAAVVIVHELFAVSPDIQSVATALMEEGVLAIAPEFYHRQAAPGEWLDRDPTGRTRGFELLNSLTREQVLLDIEATLNYLRNEYAITDVTLLGFSAGGHIAFLAACELSIRKAVILYAGWLTTTDIPLSRPEPTIGMAPKLSGTLLYLVGDADHVVSAPQIAQIKQALTDSPARTEVVTYPGVGHAFFWPGTEAFDREARDDAWRRILTLVREVAAPGEAG